MAVSAASKPSARDLLLVAGREIALRDGFQALTVRGVATAAGANLGSFVYHFGTRDAFVEQLIEEWYAPLLDRVVHVADSEAAPLDRLRQAILQLIDFGTENDAFIGRLFMAAVANDPSARRFLSSLAARHPRLLLQLIGEAQAKGAIVEEDPLQVLCFLMASVGLPRLLAYGWQGPPLFAKSIASALSRIARDRDRILQRLDWAIRGLLPQGPP
jgi:AcrR family transcriptional regulator